METTEKVITKTADKRPKLNTFKPMPNKGPLSLAKCNSIFAIFFGHRYRKIETVTEDNKVVVKKVFNINGVDLTPKELGYHLDKSNLFKIHHAMIKYGYEITIRNESVTIKNKELKVTVKDTEFPEELVKKLSHKLFYCYALALSRGMEAIKKQKMKENPTPDV